MLTTHDWQLQKPINTIVFDCDGTLSTLEGIDELARINHAGEKVAAITAEAMGQTGINPDLYRTRLELTNPHRDQVIELGTLYFKHATPHMRAIITLLQRLQKTVYIMSAGINPAVTLFGEHLGVPHTQIFAVDLEFDERGYYHSFNLKSPLTYRNGKRLLVSELKIKHPDIAHIGDGMNDYVVHDIVTRFIGYGGAFYRKSIADLCQYYVTTMTAILPLLLTQQEFLQLTVAEKNLFDEGWSALQSQREG